LAIFGYGNCTAWFYNQTDDTIVYDYRDFGDRMEWLTGECLIRFEGGDVGISYFPPDQLIAIVFVVLSFYFCSRMKLNLLSLLVSVTQRIGSIFNLKID